MGYYDEFDNENKPRGPIGKMIIGVSLGIMSILIIVFAVNNTTTGKNNLKRSQMLAGPTATKEKTTAVDVAENYTDADGNKDIERLYKDNKLRAEDLDFWDMYDKGGQVISNGEPIEGDEVSDRELLEGLSEEEIDAMMNTENRTGEDNSEQMEDVEDSNIDFKNLKIVNNKMHYYIGEKEVSKLGVDISGESGVVNYDTLKNSDVDFVMIKVGERGYDSGIISLDDNFKENIKEAEEAGLDIGLYFSSRAVTKAEAEEEADYCAMLADDYRVEYPIAYLFEGEMFESARTDDLGPDELTELADAFMSEIKIKGYETILYGSKNFILDELIPEDILPKYDVMLNYIGTIPDYPYKYKMWRYVNNMSIDGMEKPGAYIISFVDFASR